MAVSFVKECVFTKLTQVVVFVVSNIHTDRQIQSISIYSYVPLLPYVIGTFKGEKCALTSKHVIKKKAQRQSNTEVSTL